MKKVITISLLLCSIVTFAQVSIGNVEEEKPVHQETKIPVYDSLSNFQRQENPRNYSQYRGYKFYLPPKIEKWSAPAPTLYTTHSKKATDNEDDIYNKYYTYLGLRLESKLKSMLIDDKLYFYHKDGYVQQASRMLLNRISDAFWFGLKDDNGDTLYCDFKTLEKFIFVPYFVKQKSLYEKKTFYYINTTPNSKWICKEVTLLKYSQVMNYAPEDEYVICYVFINHKNESLTKIGNPFYPEKRNDRIDGIRYFISEKEFIAKEEAKKKEEQRVESKNEADTEKRKQDKAAKYQRWIKDYGQENADLISNGKVKLGMTKAMCLESWGLFFTPSKTVNEQGTFEIWMYSIKQVLYFKDGILTQIEQ